MTNALLFQLMRFGVVGLIASAVHFSIVVSLVQYFAIHPLVANIFGFIVSFQVSYWGHRTWTFDGASSLHRIAFPKLLFIQLINLSLNESLFYTFLSMRIPYPLALLFVLSILPIFTFITSKFWVFR